MRFLFLFLLTELVAAGVPAPAIQTELRALQQMRTLIPERLWEQEFSIRIDRTGMKREVEKLSDHRLRSQNFPAVSSVGHSVSYFDRRTISGEEIRILDTYEEFLHSPYWQTPRLLERLRKLKSGMKEETR